MWSWNFYLSVHFIQVCNITPASYRCATSHPLHTGVQHHTRFIQVCNITPASYRCATSHPLRTGVQHHTRFVQVCNITPLSTGVQHHTTSYRCQHHTTAYRCQHHTTAYRCTTSHHCIQVCTTASTVACWGCNSGLCMLDKHSTRSSI